HDIWLMTFDPASINFRLEKLLESLGKAKNSEKELLSIIKVLQELIKGINGDKVNKDEFLIQKKGEISTILQNTKKNIITQIENSSEPSKNLLLGKLLPHLNLTEAEKKQVKGKRLEFGLGVDFNKSDIKNFQTINGQILIPFSAITGIGESYARRIIDYRQKKGQINN
ncbi:9118_t:CDS:2, partial [Entrophospora sp. SA101]